MSWSINIEQEINPQFQMNLNALIQRQQQNQKRKQTYY